MFSAVTQDGVRQLAFAEPLPGRYFCEVCGGRVVLRNAGANGFFAHLPGADPCPTFPGADRESTEGVENLSWRISKLGWSYKFNVRLSNELIAPLVVESSKGPVVGMVSSGRLSEESFAEITSSFNDAGFPVWWVFTESILSPAQEGASRMRLSGGVVAAQRAGYGLLTVIDSWKRLLLVKVVAREADDPKTIRLVEVFGPLSKKTLGESSRLWLAVERRPLWVAGSQRVFDLVRLESTRPSLRRRINAGTLPQLP